MKQSLKYRDIYKLLAIQRKNFHNENYTIHVKLQKILCPGLVSINFQCFSSIVPLSFPSCFPSLELLMCV